jgi:hypothetical protein
MGRRKQSQHERKTKSFFYTHPEDIKAWLLGSNSTSEGKEKACEQIQDSHEETARPPKRRKLNAILSDELERHDATSLVPHYTSAKQVPEHLQKCESELELGNGIVYHLTSET